MESDVTEMLGVMDTKNVYHKLNQSTRDIDVINKHLADTREYAVNNAHEAIDEDNVTLGVQ